MKKFFKCVGALGLAAIMGMTSQLPVFANDESVIYPDGTPVYCKMIRNVISVNGGESVRVSMDSHSSPVEMMISGTVVDTRGHEYVISAYGYDTYGISDTSVTGHFIRYAQAKCEAWADNGDYASTDMSV